MSAALVEVPEVDEGRKRSRLVQIFEWLLFIKPQPCSNCVSELAILSVERDLLLNRDYKASDRMCRKRDAAERSCIEKIRPLWKDRPREELAPKILQAAPVLARGGDQAKTAERSRNTGDPAT